jgi:hypothetical protein
MSEIGHQHDEARKRRAEREYARPFIRRWLIAIKAKVADKSLGEFPLRLAEKMTCVPSANLWKAYLGQIRLGLDLGKSPRTVRGALKDMRDEGLLIRKRGLPGQTATWWFAINGKLLFETASGNTAEHGQVVDVPAHYRRNRKRSERQDSAGLERQDSAAKLLEENLFERDPLEPPITPACGDAERLVTGSGDSGCGGETLGSLAIKEVEPRTPRRDHWPDIVLRVLERQPPTQRQQGQARPSSQGHSRYEG